jgi:catechol 2,3-dioxygenase-like lactoylglutathione lyase family enzyme
MRSRSTTSSTAAISVTGSSNERAAQSLVWLGVRTERFTEMTALYRDGLGPTPIHQTETAVWFRLGDGNEVHLYAQDDTDHAFFGPGPVVGFLVEDFTAARARLEGQGASFIGEPQEAGGAIWCHYRAPDGNIYEIIQRAAERPTPRE